MMLKEKLKNLIEEAIVHMKIKPIDKDEMKYAKRKIDHAINFFQDIAEMKKKSMEFSNIAELRATDIPEGTVVATKGFYTEGDAYFPTINDKYWNISSMSQIIVSKQTGLIFSYEEYCRRTNRH